MRRYLILAWLVLFVVSVGAVAQTVTGSGTAGTVPLFSGSGTSSSIGNSPVSLSYGHLAITPLSGWTWYYGDNSQAPVWIGKTGSPGGISFARSSDGSPQGYIGYQGSGDSGAGTFSIESLGGGNLNFYTTGAHNFYIGNTQTMIIANNGNVGIGTTNPQYSLSVNGTSYVFDSTQIWSAPFTSALNLSPTYHVVNGIGNTGAITTLAGSGTSANANGLGTIALYTNSSYTTSNSGNTAGGAFVDVLSNPASITIQPGAGSSFLAHYYADPSSAYSLNSQALSEYGFFSNLAVNPATGVTAYAFFGSGTAPSYFGGNVGIGTTAPAYNLDVTGKIHSTSGVVYPDGTQQTTAWTGVLCGGDYAEAVDAAGSKKAYGPGDVLVITDGTDGDVKKSVEPYATTVAGIFATKPGVIGRREALPKDGEEVPMAMVGIVPTKVTAENGPIHRGDLLVTSSRPGYAMRGTDRNRMLGAVIGKAMGTLDASTGVIEVLVTLQ